MAISLLQESFQQLNPNCSWPHFFVFRPQFWWDSSPCHVFYAQVCEAVCSRLWTSFRMRPAGLWGHFLFGSRRLHVTQWALTKSNSLVPEEFIEDPNFLNGIMNHPKYKLYFYFFTITHTNNIPQNQMVWSFWIEHELLCFIFCPGWCKEPPRRLDFW